MNQSIPGFGWEVDLYMRRYDLEQELYLNRPAEEIHFTAEEWSPIFDKRFDEGIYKLEEDEPPLFDLIDPPADSITDIKEFLEDYNARAAEARKNRQKAK